jgi:hypothetical protein
MAFPTNPDIGDTHVEFDTTWTYGNSGWYRTIIGSSNETFYNYSRGGGATPAGTDGDVQINDNGDLGFVSGFRWDPDVLSVPGDLNLDDGGSFQTTLQLVTPTANRTISFPDDTGTVALVAGSTTQVQYNDAGKLAGSSILTFSTTDGLRTSIPFGYQAGSGGNVTQLTNKSTGVTLNKGCGRITTHNESLSANSAATFTLTNSFITSGDVIVINHISGGTIGAYTFSPSAGTGSATITIRNVSGGAEGSALVLKFVIIKSCTGN